MIKVVVLGAGNLGTHLCIELEKNTEILLLQNYNRKGASIEKCGVPVTNDKFKIEVADVYIFAISDDALSTIGNEFSHLKGLVVHTSGSTPMSIFSNFEKYGVFYPLQSFNKSVSVNFSAIPIVVEAANKHDEDLLFQLAKTISKSVYKLNSQQRNSLHVAAVFANNFSNFMYTQAAQICVDKNIDFSILKPLIVETIEKIIHSEPKNIQTGPAVRNDSETIKRHLQTLQDNEQIELYKSLTTSIQKHYKII